MMNQSLQIIRDILLNMENPASVKALALDATNVNPAPLTQSGVLWSDLSLSNGYPSLLLLFSTLEKQGLITRGDVIAHSYVVKIKESIESQGISNLSLFSGVSGICFALQQASFDGTRYQRMLQTLNAFLIEKVEGAYLEPLKFHQSQSLPISPRLYDPIQGVCGIGRYALENLSLSSFVDIATRISKALVALSGPILYKGQSVPGWFLSPNDTLNSRNRQSCPEGTFNLGLAHGVVGILAFLSIASLRGIDVQGQLETIDRIAHWVRGKSVVHNDAIMWPYHVPWEDEVRKNPTSITGSKDAWCYGVPGIARVLFLAGKALQDEELKTFAVMAFRGIFSRKQHEWELPGCALCHGLAGLLLITHEMSKEDGCEDLIEKVEELEKALLLRYSPQAPWGFKDVEACRQGKTCELNKPGFLEGSAGILLTLASLSKPAGTWHLPLLIHA